MDAKKLVLDTLNFKNDGGRVPRDMWVLGVAKLNHPEFIEYVKETYPMDIINAPLAVTERPVKIGSSDEIGTYIDEWRCNFTNIYQGIIGEVKNPIIKSDEWEDYENIHIPYELLTLDYERISAFCKEKSDKYILAGYCPRPFERLQFIRGTENLFMDLVDPPPLLLKFMKGMHEFYCNIMEKWAKSDVDALFFMDDWGTQTDLLISPDLWRKYFKPMYKDYADIAHKHGKKIFMHSDGHILRIIPDLIDIEIDALNSQIFCMGIENLKQFKGKITFWGEIDRQHLIPSGTTDEIDMAVKEVYDTLWCNGGCIAQCEFGLGAKTENIEQIYQSWNNVDSNETVK